MTCSRGPQGGIKPGAAAATTQPLFMGALVAQSVERVPQITEFSRSLISVLAPKISYQSWPNRKILILMFWWL